MAKKEWFSVRAVALAQGAGEDDLNVGKVSLFDEIGGWGISAREFREEIKALGEVDRIDLEIHSPGGSVIDGWAIYDLLKNHPAPVHARIGALAASMATVIAMAADQVEMAENAFFMVHNPWSVAIGDADEMRATADLLDKMQDGITRAYVGRSGLDEQEVKDLMKAESWLTGAEALELGFVDSLGATMEAAALSADVEAMADTIERLGMNVPQCEVSALDELTEEESAELEAAVEAAVDSAFAGVDADGGSVEVVEPGDDGAGEGTRAPSEAGGFLDRIGKLFSARGGAGSPVAAQREVAELRAQLEVRGEEIAAARSEVAELKAQLDAAKSEAVAVEALVVERLAEAGLAFEEIEELPAPRVSEDAPGSAAQPLKKQGDRKHFGVAGVKVRSQDGALG